MGYNSGEGKLQVKRSADNTDVSMTALLNLPLQTGKYFGLSRVN